MTEQVPSKERVANPSIAAFDEFWAMMTSEQNAERTKNLTAEELAGLTWQYAAMWSAKAMLAITDEACRGAAVRALSTVATKEPSRDLVDYGYAPGGYIISCFDCKQKAWDCDKRASVCKPCAEKRRDRASQPPPVAQVCGEHVIGVYHCNQPVGHTGPCCYTTTGDGQ